MSNDPLSSTTGLTYANQAVLEFYKELPFNYGSSIDMDVSRIVRQNPLAAYPMLAPLLDESTRVLEVGCGVGWLSNAIAYHHGSHVTAIDFNPRVIERARDVAQALGTDVEFRVEDVFLYDPQTQFDLVVSVGVLHHTDNCLAGVERVFETFTRPGGRAFLGLYHHYGRRPFLDHFEAMKQRGADEEEMLAEYRVLHPQLKDDVLALSWFRDQVLHPKETQHTLEELLPLLESSGMTLEATSVNRFAPIDSLEALVEQEKGLAAYAQQILEQRRYFPGFFIVLCQKARPPAASPAGTAPT